MLPGNLQYWQPCRWGLEDDRHEQKGTKDIQIIEPIHFSGPSPGYQSAIAEEEKKEQSQTSQSDRPQVADNDDPNGAAQQSTPDLITTPVQRPIKEEVKEPEPPQQVQQSVDPNQATLQAFQSILAQQLSETREQLKEQLRE